ncbi:PPE family protein [[Mycobacterium] nativiensis]|uniref:PPE family protein n=1 Tax=[Mycobacterium] nativiensis TaxID=2855503 RepID=A0ABU5XUE2_9MYCO|nr:PPE family protein [Mycolicibacter sp. MYC340]MEB3031533.1 PPE family protein [Mycolicibacter sp. MYC340]
MRSVTAPPEISSGLVLSGPGAGSLVAAAAAWRQLGAGLDESADDCVAALSSLVGTWHGPTATAMVQAAEPYLIWLRSAAQRCRWAAASAQSAAAAFESVRAAVVPTAQVAANRTRRAQLLAANRFGNYSAAIAENEGQYLGMWTNNTAAMTRYQAASAQATTLAAFNPPAPVTATAGPAGQATAGSAAVTSLASSLTGTTSPGSTLSSLESTLESFDPNTGWPGLANTYANQFVSSGFPLNLLSYLAQNTSAQALQNVNTAMAQGLAEGEAALIPAVPLGGLGALGAAGLSSTPAAAVGVGVSVGPLTAPPAAAGFLAATQTPVQLASSVSPLAAGESAAFAGMPPMLPPVMPPPLAAGSGWRKRKQQKYEDLEVGLELRGPVMPKPPSAG